MDAPAPSRYMAHVRSLRCFSLLVLAACALGCGSNEDVPTHVRVHVDSNFPLLNLVYLDVVVHWGSECTSDRWLLTSANLPSSPNTGGMTFAAFPTSFDVLPQNDASRESVTVFVAGVDSSDQAVAVDYRTVTFEPGKRVSVDLFLTNPCAPQPCNAKDDYDPDSGLSEGKVRHPEEWCSASIRELQEIRPVFCSCGLY